MGTMKPTAILAFVLLLMIELHRVTAYRVAAHEWPQAVEGTKGDLLIPRPSECQGAEDPRCKKEDLLPQPQYPVLPLCTLEAHCRRV